MKIVTILPIVSAVFLALNAYGDDPRTNSWFTTYSGQYARIYTNDICRTNGISVTVWTNGTSAQTLPAYCGIQEVYSSSNYVYVRSTGFGSHIMGAWYLNANHTQIFPNWPTNQKVLFRIPRTTSVPAKKTLSGGGAVGIFVDGVAMFNNWDAYFWNGTTEVSGTATNGFWNRDAYVNEGSTFDPANAHQPGSGQYHYHANPPALRYELGDHVDFDSRTKVYTEFTNTATKHSPILGWAADGFPIYGPYGYVVSNDSSSGIKRMVSGYVLRNGQYGTSNLTANGRTTIPQWAVRLYGVASNVLSGPNVSTSYPLGRYMEDNDYLGDHAYVQGKDFDLDEYNGRWCVTPEFPNGTYAYFVSITSNGTPAYPYNIGLGYYGNPAGGSVSLIAETVVTNFLGNTNSVPTINSPTIKNGKVTLTWSAIEGGSYQVEATTNLANPSDWQVLSNGIAPNQVTGIYSNAAAYSQQFYRVNQTSVSNFDSTGATLIAAAVSAPGGSATRSQTVYMTITLPSTPPNPPANSPVSSVYLTNAATLWSLNGTSISHTATNLVSALFTITNVPAGVQTDNVVVVFGSPAPTYVLTNGFTIN